MLWIPSIINAHLNFEMQAEGISPEHNIFLHADATNRDNITTGSSIQKQYPKLYARSQYLTAAMIEIIIIGAAETVFLKVRRAAA